MVIVKGEVVELRQISTLEEKALILEWRNSDRIRMNMYNSNVTDEASHYRWLEGVQGDPSKLYMIAYDSLNNIPIGLVYIVNISTEFRHADWGFYVGHDEYLNAGHAIEMEYLTLKYVFGEMGLHRLSCTVLEFNEQVISFHKKFGFVEEGKYRQFLFRDGKWMDVVLLSILEEEYRETIVKINPLLEKVIQRIKRGNM